MRMTGGLPHIQPSLAVLGAPDHEISDLSWHPLTALRILCSRASQVVRAASRVNRKLQNERLRNMY